MTEFVDFLNEEREKRTWSMSELGRRADLSHAIISDVLAEKVPITPDFCIKVGHALGEGKAEYLLRLAGYLPPLPPQVEEEQHVIRLVRSMPPLRRQVVLDVARGLAQRPDAPMGHTIQNLDDPIRQAVDALYDATDEAGMHVIADVVERFYQRLQQMGFIADVQEETPEDGRLSADHTNAEEAIAETSN